MALATPPVPDFKGVLIDADSHLETGPEELTEILGKELASSLISFLDQYTQRVGRGLNVDSSAPVRTLGERAEANRLARSQPPCDEKSIWRLKGPEALGFYCAKDRLQALDLMGVQKQLIFPQPVVAAAVGFDTPLQKRLVSGWNDYVVRWSKQNPSRLFPAGVLSLRDVGETAAEAERALKQGVRSFSVEHGAPPAGLSPADPQWDSLYHLLAEANAPLLFHIGQGMRIVDWRFSRTEALCAKPQRSGESIGPVELLSAHWAPQMFVQAMILGGVLERHPKLRIGIIEYGATWASTWLEEMDHAAQIFQKLVGSQLKLKPSEYAARQLRITPYCFEDPAHLLDRLPCLEDMLCFSSDYPHIEGGIDTLDMFYERMRSQSPDRMTKFFRQNGEFLVPN